MVHFAAMLAQDIGPRGVRANVVSPGFTDTENAKPSEEEKQAVATNTALRRCGISNDVAGAVLPLRSPIPSETVFAQFPGGENSCDIR